MYTLCLNTFCKSRLSAHVFHEAVTAPHAPFCDDSPSIPPPSCFPPTAAQSTHTHQRDGTDGWILFSSKPYLYILWNPVVYVTSPTYVFQVFNFSLPQFPFFYVFALSFKLFFYLPLVPSSWVLTVTI